jgi:hypothetical protein
MFKIKVTAILLYLISCVTSLSAETIKLDGGPMAFDIGYGIIVNEGSSLAREAVIVRDARLPAFLKTYSATTPLSDRNYVHKIEYELTIKEPVSAIEVRFIPFDVWGDQNRPLSSTTVEDIATGDWSSAGFWTIYSEADASTHYAMLGYVAQVKLASGEIIKANPELVIKAAQNFSEDFTAGDLEDNDD